MPGAVAMLGACGGGGAAARGWEVSEPQVLGFCNKKDVLLLLGNQLR